MKGRTRTKVVSSYLASRCINTHQLQIWRTLSLPLRDCAENTTIHFLTLLCGINNQATNANFVFSQKVPNDSLYEDCQAERENERVEFLLLRLVVVTVCCGDRNDGAGRFGPYCFPTSVARATALAKGLGARLTRLSEGTRNNLGKTVALLLVGHSGFHPKDRLPQSG